MFDAKNFKNLTPSEKEEKILNFWQQNKTFEKSLLKKASRGSFVFYDGPPFANGLPHYGHILASIIKDVIPRYWTMKGYKVPRRWGWDCHGLPVETEIEKELGFKSKKDIEKFGIEKFNKAAKDSVLKYADEWKKIIPRIGRWVDMENDYKTMDAGYTESVWWVFKTLFDKKLIYEGYKSMHLCPRCETILSNFEVSQNYKDITDISVFVKFELIDEKNTFVLVWTTTPWTLPGNVALAINQNIKYQVVSIRGDDSKYIIAQNRVGDVLKDKEYKILKEFKGKDLIGKEYKLLFNDYENWRNFSGNVGVLDGNVAQAKKSTENFIEKLKNGWKIYAADFVTTEEGTGIVHIAPAFGEDDMELAKKYNLPFIQHVGIDGKFKSDIYGGRGIGGEFKNNFMGLSVKPRENHQSTDIEIIKWLAKENKLFNKQKIVHSYPYCWRCETPLINYASSSWFVKVQAVKNDLIKNNKKIDWVPSHIKNGRFGKWLEDARDWAISRSRFWGAPLPVWKCQKCNKLKTIGSIREIKENLPKSGNKYFVMRHGMAEHNVKNIASAKVKNGNHLVEKGRKQSLAAANKLKKEKIDFIFSSDFTRTKETAEIVAKNIGLAKNKIIFDERLREVNVGVFDGRSTNEYHNYFYSLEEKFYKNPPQGENLIELKNRASEFLYKIDGRYSGKNILIISHEYTIWCLFAGAAGADVKTSVEMKINKNDFIKTGEIMKLNFVPLPHNKNFELDLHRPYIDEVQFLCECGSKKERIKEVFDCWFESGAMPYGQAHYPFENKKEFEKNFPAEFIAEGLDQTRGWFYTLLVLSTALFNKPAYKNVIVNGIILNEDGQKMSKRLKNYPDPMEIINKYGADALRLYLLASPAVKGENLNFSEKGVDEIYKKVILRLWNSYQFYEMYADRKVSSIKHQASSKNVLDKWILARLNQSIGEISDSLDKYELDCASRPIIDFIDDFSTWYIRRSRERFKKESKDKQNAVATINFIFVEFAKAVASFLPFIAEGIYKSLGNGKSVHLENWPSFGALTKIDKEIIEKMSITRKIVEDALALRQKAGIRVRQPLASLKIRDAKLKIKNEPEFLDLIKDEINVKEIIFAAKINPPSALSGGGGEIEIDIKITPELKAEGDLRELTRFIQDLRKKAGLKPDQKIILEIQTNETGKKLFKKFENEIKKSIGATKIEFIDLIDGEEIKIDELEFKINIKK
ncbi:MAG: Isoleucine-tRNA ligase [Candidatus Wolfebacteria bacterium GW2011_GWA1_44_24]|uniref:Isoleucine--tRNA ligase n=1 Tax=Candidatus Wolfebacteria bacterium GW2011_GWB1_41_12 TaxID=1619006 RepID=A0A0G0XLL8_9BACT|nr:MAG: Isoleucine-tRNA ligase [Candidatus Wolfebacteria bacterium GW2011_GWB1_41_12]KKT56822.1 MAG: Isoleucine-tRNA ligase [Candidatus Wolfebacteria bacterium GW2011_GWA1_44_24]